MEIDAETSKVRKNLQKNNKRATLERISDEDEDDVQTDSRSSGNKKLSSSKKLQDEIDGYGEEEASVCV